MCSSYPVAYLAGPMRGLPDHNFPAFHAAARDLRERCLFTVVSPAESDVNSGFDPTVDTAGPLRDYMGRDLAAVCESDLVVVLDGWELSQGALLEVTVAAYLDIPVHRYPDLDVVATLPTIGLAVEMQLDVADVDVNRLVAERQRVYGHPFDDFSRTARLWSVAFEDLLRPGRTFGPLDVSQAQRLLKESRLRETPDHRDSLDDIAGYSRCSHMVIDRIDETALGLTGRLLREECSDGG